MDSTPILRAKQADVLMCLRDKTKDWSIGELAGKTGSTYVHVCNFIRECESKGIVESQKHGKDKMIKLTNKGELLASHIDSIYSLLNQSQEQAQTRTTA
ncbi:MAG: MarR family winged helix-turn-helix transcriptional regulator [Candidatus Marsarchaeota archaeon]|nr:MarR family winged helix-turn-helix transcriptional regulator [Candidatus Marsarchaeota archaeon]MCL5101969.1 MarR family winged helix-turn-helix transcriptional regulator [Candidatus Marsarchaeota archaeon]